MNEFEPVSARQMDRLVDGELSSAERRDVLVALEQDVNGWRRLALAFLESQALREELQSRRQPVGAMVNRRRLVHSELPDPTRTSKRRRWPAKLAMSLCAIVMFGLGRISTDTNPLKPRELPALSAGNTTHTHPGQPAQVTYQSADTVRADANEQKIQVADTGSQGKHQQQTLRLELGNDDGSPTQAIEVPMFENSGLQPEDLLQGPPVIPERIQRDWLRQGRRVYEQRRLYEVTLEDGRRGVVPVSDVLVENAGWGVYQ